MGKRKQETLLEFWESRRPDFFKKGGVLYSKNTERLFDIGDLQKCFEESRLTHPMVGFKHDTFEDYLKWVDKQNEG